MNTRPVPGERPAFLDTWEPLTTLVRSANRPLMIVFYRGFWCDYCRQQLESLIHAAPAFRQRGIELIAVTTDVAAEHQELLDRTMDVFPVLIDTGGELITRLDLVDPFEFRSIPVSLPAVFLMDDAGVVRYQYVGRSPDDRPKTELLLLAAEHLTQGKN